MGSIFTFAQSHQNIALTSLCASPASVLDHLVYICFDRSFSVVREEKVGIVDMQRKRFVGSFLPFLPK